MVNNFPSVTHLFLDLDGTLVNSLPYLRQLYFDFLKEYEKKGSREEFLHLKKNSIESLIDYCKKKYALVPPLQELKKKYQEQLGKFYGNAPLFTGVTSFLRQSSASGLHLILTTNCQKKPAEQLLKGHRIDHYFNRVYTPACFHLKTKNVLFYRKVTEALGIQEGEALVIDDSWEAIASSLQAGLRASYFSKINYHPIPSFSNWKQLTKQWISYVAE